MVTTLKIIYKMDFENVLKENIYSFFKNEGFDIIKENNNLIEFKSSSIRLRMAFNNREKSYFIEIGRTDDTLYPFDDLSIKEIIGYNPYLNESCSHLEFVQKIIKIFYSEEGYKLLKGNIESLIFISKKRSNAYKKEIELKHILDKASIAWNERDYIAFITILSNISQNDIPTTFSVKLKIAKSQLK